MLLHLVNPHILVFFFPIQKERWKNLFFHTGKLLSRNFSFPLCTCGLTTVIRAYAGDVGTALFVCFLDVTKHNNCHNRNKQAEDEPC